MRIPDTVTDWASRNDPLNGVTSKYVVTTNAHTGILPNKTCLIDTGYVTKGRVFVVKDDSYSYDTNGAAQLLSDITGMEIVFELAVQDYSTIQKEYELVTPIYASIKAGTTEARISPNADGLSAPMVCDMTYDVDCEYILGEVNNKLGDIESILETI